MAERLWSNVVVHDSPDGERTFADGSTDETRRAAARDLRHAAEVKLGQAAKPGTSTDEDGPQPTIVETK